MPKITSKTVASAQPSSSAYFIRDNDLKGFALRVFPSGTIKYIAEVWHSGKSHRKTLGPHPVLTPQDARKLALSFIRDVQSGLYDDKPKEQVTLQSLFNDYTKGDHLKPSTLKSYREVIFFYLQDWLDNPVSSISKSMVEKRFCMIRDKGVFGGIPTYSSATKTMRTLSALMNYALADDSIQSNPVNVLKYKRVDRSMRKREHYLKHEEVREMLQKTAQETHPVTLALHLMLHAGLRKNEALRLKWSDLETVDGVECLLIRDTKNHRPHYVPITDKIRIILGKAENPTDYLFPSPLSKNCNITDERPTIKRLSKTLGFTFKCHDLRRTFATRAAEVGIDYLMIKRLLNHKSNDITAQYIQWNSAENLSGMKKEIGVFMIDERPTMKRLSKLIQYDFRCHGFLNYPFSASDALI